MRIAFIQTYPIYHDAWSTEQFLAIRNRDRWMPGILAADGHTVELWGVDRKPSEHLSRIDGFGDYPIRLFAADGGGSRTKFHRSQALLDHARSFDPELCLLKGVDGGCGEHLVNQFLGPESRAFGVIIGGAYYARYLSQAIVVFYESDFQRNALENPGYRMWRKSVPRDRLVRLFKSVDTRLFRPMPEVEKEFDIMIVGRLIRRLKSFSYLDELSTRFSVAVVGSGLDAEALRSKFPRAAWLGRVSHTDVPCVLNRARTLFHPGRREFYPRVLAEAAACGLPAIAFEGSIAGDVLPPGVGLRLTPRDFLGRIGQLLSDSDRLRYMGENARIYAKENLNIYSSRSALDRVPFLMKAR